MTTRRPSVRRSLAPDGARRSTGLATFAAALALIACACTEEEAPRPDDNAAVVEEPRSERSDERARMVQHIRTAYGFDDERVLAAMMDVPRHRFVPPDYRPHAYADHALPIGHDQTISQPYIVASMTAAARLQGDEKVLEIGTGSGYQAAILAEVAAEVFTIEIVPPLGERAAAALAELGYDNVHVRIGDGYRGWPEAAPFDAILVTAAPDHVPEPLRQQLKIGGRLVMPLGDFWQDLVVITRTADGFRSETLMGVRFVPMTGEAQRRDG